MVINYLFYQSVNCSLWKEKNFSTVSLTRMAIKLNFYKKKTNIENFWHGDFLIFQFYCRFKIFSEKSPVIIDNVSY